VAVALLDYETPLWLDSPLAGKPAIAQWIRFHTGARVTADPRQASFAIIAEAADPPSFDHFALGTAEYPDRSTTLVLQVERFGSGQCLSSPGQELPVSGPCRPNRCHPISMNGLASTMRCFHAVSISSWCPGIPLRPCRARSSRSEVDDVRCGQGWGTGDRKRPHAARGRAARRPGGA
jgi:phosphonate C-P lyase system protein PhnH